MKISSDQLIGEALNWAVATALGESVWMRHGFLKARAQFILDTTGWAGDLEWQLSVQTNDPIIGDVTTGGTACLPDYCGDWAWGGPIIDRELIAVFPYRDMDGWEAVTLNKSSPQSDIEVDGPTALVAAMRAFVAVELGDEVDIPDVLGSPRTSTDL